MTDDTDRPSGSETDWLAWCTEAYGFGFTREQALLSMAANVDPTGSNPLRVDLVEHIGDVAHGRPGWDAEREVSHEKIAIPPGDVVELHDAAVEAKTAGRVLERATAVEPTADE